MRQIAPLFAALLVFALALGSSLGAALPAAAQDDAPSVGTAVPFVDEEGIERGTITVTEVTDPYTEFDPNQPPEAGSRYLLLTLAFEATTGERYDIDPFAVTLQDADGYLRDRASVPLSPDAIIPELQSQTLAPGSRVSGVVGFVVPEEATPARVYYQPESSRLILLADLLGTSPPALGSTLEIVDAEGGTGSVTVAEVADPFEGFDPNSPPETGARYVLLTLVYENTGDGRFQSDPFALLLRDADGYLWGPTFINRPAEQVIIPDLDRQQLAPGDRVSGAVGFVVPGDVPLAGLHYQPESGRLILLADFQADVDAVPATEEGDEGDDEDATSETDVMETPVTAAGDCAGVDVWLAATAARFQRATEMIVEDATLEDLAAIEAHIAEYAALAEAQRTDPVPPAAAAINQALVDTLNAFSAALEQILTADDPDKELVVELTAGMNSFNEAGVRMGEIDAQILTLAADCGFA